MTGDRGVNGTDLLIREVLSYHMYMRKKAPLPGTDPKRRTREGAWKEDGVDLDVLIRKGHLPKGTDASPLLFAASKKRVPSGLFALRSEHTLIIELMPLSRLLGAVSDLIGSEEVGIFTDPAGTTGSGLFLPLYIHMAGRDRWSCIRKLTLTQKVQSSPGDISFQRALTAFVRTDHRPVKHGEGMETIFKPPRNGQQLAIAGRSGHRDIASMLFSLFELPDPELSSVMASGDLQRTAREAGGGPYLEALMGDLTVSPGGGLEGPEQFRTRLGRVLLESASGDRFHRRFVQPALHKLLTCSKPESERISAVLWPLMDPRSAPQLLDLLFKVPQGNRVALIDLIGGTRDRSAIEPLRRLVEFSSMEEDQRSAERALSFIGAPLRSGNGDKETKYRPS